MGSKVMCGNFFTLVPRTCHAFKDYNWFDRCSFSISLHGRQLEKDE